MNLTPHKVNELLAEVLNKGWCVLILPRHLRRMSRLNFLALLRGNYHDYVLNEAALAFLEARRIDPALLARLKTSGPRWFPNQVPFLAYLAESA